MDHRADHRYPDKKVENGKEKGQHTKIELAVPILAKIRNFYFIAK